jgi:tRNA (guanine-N7-)-methyltransferase
MRSYARRTALPITIMVASMLPWRGIGAFSLRFGASNTRTLPSWILRSSSSSETTIGTVTTSTIENSSKTARTQPPWNDPALKEIVITKKRNNNARFRQHVNPLARQYQQQTVLPDDWPASVFADCATKPLYLDIGCGKGGFLIDLCKAEDDDTTKYNYLGIEIRPGVAAYAKERIAVHQLQGRLDFLGCNANVDLDRLLTLYQEQHDPAMHCLQRVSIQFPDPHFKNQHSKRRVVTPSLIDTLAKYMPANATVFLQSDVQCKWQSSAMSCVLLFDGEKSALLVTH